MAIQIQDRNSKEASEGITELRPRIEYRCPESELFSIVEHREEEESA